MDHFGCPGSFASGAYHFIIHSFWDIQGTYNPPKEIKLCSTSKSNKRPGICNHHTLLSRVSAWASSCCHSSRVIRTAGTW